MPPEARRERSEAPDSQSDSDRPRAKLPRMNPASVPPIAPSPAATSASPAPTEVTIDPWEQAEIEILQETHPQWSREQIHKEFNSERAPEEVKSLDEFNRIYNAILHAQKGTSEERQVQKEPIEESQGIVPESAEVWLSTAKAANSFTTKESRVLLQPDSEDTAPQLAELKRRYGEHYVYQQRVRLPKMGMTLAKLDKLVELGFDRIPIRRIKMPAWMLEEDIKLLETFRYGKKGLKRPIVKDIAEAYNKIVESGRERTESATWRRWENLIRPNGDVSDSKYAEKIAELEAKVAAITDPSAPNPYPA